MAAVRLRRKRDDLRAILRMETRTLHDRLDRLMAPMALGAEPDYATFLSIQYSVRAAIENWIEPRVEAALRPPRVSNLLEADLADLGCSCPNPVGFSLPDHSDPIGMAWAIGGSSLGNRALTAQRRSLAIGGPSRFLDETETTEFFRTLLPLLAITPDAVSSGRAVSAAEAVFLAFLEAAESPAMDLAA